MPEAHSRRPRRLPFLIVFFITCCAIAGGNFLCALQTFLPPFQYASTDGDPTLALEVKIQSLVHNQSILEQQIMSLQETLNKSEITESRRVSAELRASLKYIFSKIKRLEKTMAVPQSQRLASSLLPQGNVPNQKNKPNGVFVIKVHRAEHASKTICTLNRFVNQGPKYPIRLFVDNEYTDKTLQTLQMHANGANLEIIVDTESWRRLPSTLTETERATVIANCKNFSTPEDAICTKMNYGLAYLNMGYWRYMHMADEPALQQFEYFVSIDADAYLTERMPDPFQIMADNNLTGIYNVEIAQYSWIKEGIQEAAEAVFSLEERQNRYLDSRQYPFFGRKGKWHRAGQGPPAIYGFFFGGRFDLFQTPKYRDFARRVVPYTYTYRTDEQGVIGVAWSLLADNDKIWYLPNHGYKMGVYHQGFLDQSQVIKNKEGGDKEPKYNLNTLHSWSNFTFIPNSQHLSWKEYLETKGYQKNDTIFTVCAAACDKSRCNPYRGLRE